MHNNKQEA